MLLESQWPCVTSGTVTLTVPLCFFRYQEENEHLSAQQLSKMKIFEQEKADLIAMYTRRQEDWNAQRSDELDRLSEQHRWVK